MQLLLAIALCLVAAGKQVRAEPPPRGDDVIQKHLAELEPLLGAKVGLTKTREAPPGIYAAFERGGVFWTPSHDLQTLPQAAHDVWRRAGAENSCLGFLIGRSRPRQGKNYFVFERGRLIETSSGAFTIECRPRLPFRRPEPRPPRGSPAAYAELQLSFRALFAKRGLSFPERQSLEWKRTGDFAWTAAHAEQGLDLSKSPALLGELLSDAPQVETVVIAASQIALPANFQPPSPRLITLILAADEIKIIPAKNSANASSKRKSTLLLFGRSIQGRDDFERGGWNEVVSSTLGDARNLLDVLEQRRVNQVLELAAEANLIAAGDRVVTPWAARDLLLWAEYLGPRRSNFSEHLEALARIASGLNFVRLDAGDHRVFGAIADGGARNLRALPSLFVINSERDGCRLPPCEVMVHVESSDKSAERSIFRFRGKLEQDPHDEVGLRAYLKNVDPRLMPGWTIGQVYSAPALHSPIVIRGTSTSILAAKMSASSGGDAEVEVVLPTSDAGIFIGELERSALSFELELSVAPGLNVPVVLHDVGFARRTRGAELSVSGKIANTGDSAFQLEYLLRAADGALHFCEPGAAFVPAGQSFELRAACPGAPADFAQLGLTSAIFVETPELAQSTIIAGAELQHRFRVINQLAREVVSIEVSIEYAGQKRIVMLGPEGFGGNNAEVMFLAAGTIERKMMVSGTVFCDTGKTRPFHRETVEGDVYLTKELWKDAPCT